MSLFYSHIYKKVTVLFSYLQKCHCFILISTKMSLFYSHIYKQVTVLFSYLQKGHCFIPISTKRSLFYSHIYKNVTVLFSYLQTGHCFILIYTKRSLFYSHIYKKVTVLFSYLQKGHCFILIFMKMPFFIWTPQHWRPMVNVFSLDKNIDLVWLSFITFDILFVKCITLDVNIALLFLWTAVCVKGDHCFEWCCKYFLWRF